MASSTPSSPKHSQSGSSSSSPEFEFWGRPVVGKTTTNNSNNLPSADELFSDGILLPLQTLTLTIPTSSSSNPNKLTSDNASAFSSATSAASASPGPASKRWKDIFVKAGERERRKEQKTRLSVGNNAELNINLWPFSRSRSAGNAGGRSTAAPARRNVSSAPCSRSNSRNGDSAAPVDGAPMIAGSTASAIIKRWAETGRLTPSGGIRVRRAGTVWQLRRKKVQHESPQEESGAEDRREGIWQFRRKKVQHELPQEESGVGDRLREGIRQLRRKKVQHELPQEGAEDRSRGGVCGGNVGGKMMNLNVNTCIGTYRNYQPTSSCGDGVSAAAAGGGAAGGGVGGGGNGGMFNLKAIFSKKVY